MTRAAVYARVSTDEQAERGYSLPQQIADCQRYAQAHGFTVAGEFRDDISGTTQIGARPEGQRLAALIDAGAVDAVICYQVDRLYRDTVELLITTRDWLRAGIELHFCEGGQVQNPNDILLVIRGWAATEDHAGIVKRLARGRRGKVKSGKVMLHGDRPPYGYRVSDDGKLTIHEPEARIVRMIFDLYVNGNGTGERLSMPKVAGRLSDMGAPTWEDVHELTERKQRRYGMWAPGTIAKMLHSETYKGTWHYGKSTGSGLHPREEWIAVEVPAIVSGVLWDAAQKQAKHNRRTARRNVKHDYLMRYRLTCACGYKVQCQAKRRRLADGTTRDYLYYSCSGIRKANVRPCDLPSFRVDAVDGAIWAWVHDWLLHPKQLAQEIRTRQQRRGQELAPMRERLGAVEDLIVENETQLERLLDLYLLGKRTKELLTQRHAQLESTIDTLKDERAKLLATLEAQTLTEEQITSITELGAEIRAHLEGGATFERQRRVIEMLDVRGVLAVEDGQKVVYVQCTMAGLSGALSVASTSSWSGGQNTPTLAFTARLVLA